MSSKSISSGKPPTLWCDLMVTAGPRALPPDSITSGYSVPWARNLASPCFLAAVSNALMDDSIKGVILDSPFYDLPELLVSEVSNRTFIPPFIANLLKFGIIGI